MKFFTAFDRPNKKDFLEVNKGPILVETAGYIKPKQKIEDMVNAGKRLVEHRKEQYDFPDGRIDESVDIRTRSKGYDLADASEDLAEIQSKIDEKRAEVKNENNLEDNEIDVPDPDQDKIDKLDEKDPKVDPEKGV